MKPKGLLLRCYLEQQGDQWTAVCIDLCLAAQADSEEKAKASLQAMTIDYINEALTVDTEYAEQLLTRKAPMSQRAKYHWIKFSNHCHRLKHSIHKTFNETMPLTVNAPVESHVR